MRPRDVASLAIALAFAASCSDTPAGTRPVSPFSGTAQVTAAELNTVEGLIDALFPVGLENAARQRWAATQAAVSRGNQKAGRQHMMQLADFALKMDGQERLDDPDGDGSMTTEEGVRKLIALMFGVVFPGAPTPPTNLAGDFVLAVVDGSRQTVVTPSEFAGVEFPAGAAAEPFVLLIKRSEFTPAERCQGPLRTRLCQYPYFFEFHPFPYTVLTKAARFGVCHVTDGPFAPGKEVDGRLRLAHDAPPNAPRPGYQTVDGAEILPFTQVDFLECHPHHDLPPGEIIGSIRTLEDAASVGAQFARGLAHHAVELVLPRKAHAIDLGGGGTSDSFSNFNVVDPGPRSDAPDLVIDPRKPKIHPLPPRDR